VLVLFVTTKRTKHNQPRALQLHCIGLQLKYEHQTKKAKNRTARLNSKLQLCLHNHHIKLPQIPTKKSQAALQIITILRREN